MTEVVLGLVREEVRKEMVEMVGVQWGEGV